MDTTITQLAKWSGQEHPNREKVREALDSLSELSEAAQGLTDALETAMSSLDSQDDLMEAERYEGLSDDRAAGWEELTGALEELGTALEAVRDAVEAVD